MDKPYIKKQIKNNKIIAIIRGVRKEQIVDVVQALTAGGINLLEFTFDHINENYIEETVKKIEMCKSYFGEKVSVGAGTVLTIEEVQKAVNAGAEFIISPNVNNKVIEKTKQLDIVSIPGALTPTEAVNAYEAGADFIKLFPAGELGKNYIKALMSPLEHIPFIAVGGINTNNLREFLEIGLCGVGVGGQLINKKAINANDYNEITKIAKGFTKNIY
jgi:2-dehydro-3-deoxyphosphogluconate aldolase/(4S)-4-hydroxy-2-oxoglutarate aldolase